MNNHGHYRDDGCESDCVEHTKVPWLAWKDGSGRDLFGPSTNYTVGQCFHTPNIDSCEANARRIVACVNSCAGVTTEELETGGFVAGLIEQRDELEKLCNYHEKIHADMLERLAEAPRWRDVAEELPQEAQEVLFVRGGKVVHGAWIGGIFWHNNQQMAAATWMPLPKPPAESKLATAVKMARGGDAPIPFKRW